MKLTSNKGVPIDMTRYLAQNEGAIAVGNAKMNARGDIIGSRGQVVKPREQIAAEYHASNPKAVKKVALRDIGEELTTDVPHEQPRLEPLPEEQFVTPDQAWAQAREADRKARAKSRKIEDRDD